MTSAKSDEIINQVSDNNSWQEWSTQRLESLRIGECTIGGKRLALVVFDFNVHAGSLGVESANLMIEALEKAEEKRLPLLVITASGGTRLQEGTLAFVQIIRITQAVNKFKKAGLLFLVYLRNPTTGGVMASFASLGHVTLAEPGALISFLGPRPYETVTGRKFPKEVYSSENFYRHGAVDSLISLDEVKSYMDKLLSLFVDQKSVSTEIPRFATNLGSTKAWDAVQATRNANYLKVDEIFDNTHVVSLALHEGRNDSLKSGLAIYLARFENNLALAIANVRHSNSNHPIGVEELRSTQKAIQMAKQLNLPIVTLIDISGEDLPHDSSEVFLAQEIAHTMSELIEFSEPSVSVLLGMAVGGTAAALLPANYIIATEDSWLAPLTPEASSVVLYKSAEKAESVINVQRATVRDLVESHIVDSVISANRDTLAEEIIRGIDYALNKLKSMNAGERQKNKKKKIKQLGIL